MNIATEYSNSETYRNLNQSRFFLMNRTAVHAVRVTVWKLPDIWKFEPLQETPEKSNRQIAAGLGVSDHTVGSQRKHLESAAQSAQLERTIGADGKERPRVTQREYTEAQLSNDRAVFHHFVVNYA